MNGTITKRCGCRDAEGRQLNSSCPRLTQRAHGLFSLIQELPPREDGTRRRFRRSGYKTKTEARKDIDALRALLGIAGKGDPDGQTRIADLLETVAASGEDIPDYDETKRRFATGQSLTQHMTVTEWLDTWLAGKKALRKSGETRYEVDIRCHLKPRIGHIRLDRLTVQHLDEMFAGIAETNAEIHDANMQRRAALDELKTIPWKGVENRGRRKFLKASIEEMEPFRRITGPATQKHVRDTLRASLNTAIARGAITFNPASYVELTPAKRPKALVWTDERVEAWLRTGERPSAVMVWTPEQAGQFLDYLADTGHRLLPLFHLITFRGLRRGEACGVRWSDYSETARSMTIATQLVQDGWEVVESLPKTDSGERVFSVDEYTAEVLDAHRTKQAAERCQWGPAWIESGRMFTQEDGERIHPGWLTDQFERLVDLSGLPPIRLHDLRHVAASLMLAAGVDVKIVSETLGHSDSRITRDIYQSVMPKAAAEAAEATAAMVPRGTARLPKEKAVEPPTPQDGHTMATHEGAKIIAFRPRLVSA
ncbi:site-specific integrase [Streptomyces acidiscabies]|uniref:site-specific integrase n=1 Tax=Streptomyces acidiscabies TaxID=42234 RepID=UPI0009A0DC79|nr:site-specific integrase [Streptomyces acidiscabies]